MFSYTGKLSKLPRGFYGLPIRADFDPDDTRYIKLFSDLIYVDKNHIEHYVTSGYKTDGKTVPNIFWSIAGYPLAPATLPAAIIHDKLCDINNRFLPSSRVHEIFDEALQDLKKVPRWQRTLLVWAVKLFGPRFEATTMDNDNTAK